MFLRKRRTNGNFQKFSSRNSARRPEVSRLHARDNSFVREEIDASKLARRSANISVRTFCREICAKRREWQEEGD